MHSLDRIAQAKPKGTSRPRFTFTAQHPDDEIERLADIVREKVLAQ